MKTIFTNCTDSKWRSRNGETAEVLYQLSHDKVDIADVGHMFRIRFSDGVETDAFLDELPDLAVFRLGEVIFDITTCAMSVLAEETEKANEDGEDNVVVMYDSRDLYANIFQWAREFEQEHAALDPDGEDDGDYMTKVEEFAYAKLHEYFATNRGEM